MIEGLVSVILPIYNCEDTLQKSIESVINQTYKEWELIICDDASIDGSYEIAKKYQSKYPDKIKILRNEKNLMIAKTLNRCLEQASGEFIARMDGDDECSYERLEKEVACLKQHPEWDVVDTAMIIFDENGERGIRPGGGGKKGSLNSYFFSHPTILARRTMYERLEGYSTSKEITRCEDVDLWFRFTALGMRGGSLSEPLYKHRESAFDYKKRTLRNGINCSRILLKGCKLIGTPKWRYIYILKPILSSLIPYKMMMKCHEIKDNKDEKKCV